MTYLNPHVIKGLEQTKGNDMKHLPHYDHDERTRYDVRIVEYGAYFEEVEAHWVRGCLTLEEAQIKYAERRDEICNRIGAGASRVSTGQIFDERGQHLAYVSFNGRLWRVWTNEFLADFPWIDDYKEKRA